MESFNRWVVLEGETLKEAKKTDQLAFLELEPIKVRVCFWVSICFLVVS